MVKQVVTKFGFKVETWSNGKKGTQKFTTNHLDTVISKIYMLNINGKGMAREISLSARKYAPVIDILNTTTFAKRLNMII